MTKMQERLNFTELETSSSSNQLSQLQIENNNLPKENEELLASAKVSAAENERLKAEFDQNKLENDRIREEIQIREDKLEAEKKVDEEKQTEEKTEDQTEDKENNASYNLVSALEQELRIVSRIIYGFRADRPPLDEFRFKWLQNTVIDMAKLHKFLRFSTI